ncbi:TetR/AcrR family transcriptional regulator [Novacetimonas pomaceti]|uniref:HTH tetR-type domain-containing protein n=1 Tax=Novacetimonas pomaceti TaxID=2021998 RepID=A0ABX5P6Q1_9PROT|nr:TetR/AcrR family transcriptional regulator [Novacetimonas pomaceti]MBV1833339.1 TetR/AcrR family transcriptional regulator [Novacetimonas pomaceti]PYD48438.1 hypothetical protein C3920_04715 [Novacetimonas pomaceti]
MPTTAYSDGSRQGKRTKVLQAARWLFNRVGYQTVSVDTIRTRAGVTKATVFRHFPSKDVLVSEAIATHIHDVEDELAQAINHQTTPLAKIRAIFDWYDALFHGDDFHGCMFMHAAAEYRRRHDEITHLLQAQKDSMCSAFSHLLQSGGMEIETATMLGRTLCMLLDGAMVQAETCDNRDAAKEAWYATSHLLRSHGFMAGDEG